LEYFNSILHDGVPRNPTRNTWVQALLPVTWQRNGSADFTRPQSNFDGRSQETDFVHRLENLKSTLQSAYKIVRENNCKSHVTNKRYYDQKAKERQFRPGEIVSLFNPARKPGQSSKFFFAWQGPYKVTARLSKLNYRVVNKKRKEFLVHLI
jgi:hypothetical protein